MSHKKIFSHLLYVAVFAFASAAALLLFNNQASAVDCNGTLAPTADCPHQDVGSSLVGNYRTVLGGVGTFEDMDTGDFNLEVPACSAGAATIQRATLSWAIRDASETFWEDGVNVSVDAGSPTAVTHDRRYKTYASTSGASFEAYYSTYSADITALVLPGTHNYSISGIDVDDAGLFATTQWGAGIHVIYECPEFPESEIQMKDGLDIHWGAFVNPYAIDRSQLICEQFPADAINARVATLDIFLPGAAAPDREADIWYLTGPGVAPAANAFDLLSDVNTPANGGAVLDRLVLTSDDPEWDSYQNTAVPIPAGHEYACVQVDSSFFVSQHPDDAAASGASMISGASWFSITTPAPSTVSLGNFVWEDTNNNGIIDGAESGICGVEVQLYRDVNNDNKYVLADDGASIATTTTACGANDGEYTFTGLTPGDYIVIIPDSEFASSGPLEGYVSSTGTNGSETGPYEAAPDPDDDDTNSDDNGYHLEGVGVASCAVTLTVDGEPINDGDTDNDTNLSVDFGLFQQAKLGNFVWNDVNNNGIQDTDEVGIADATATLYDASDNSVVAVMTTDSDGMYNFCYLIAGDYYVIFSNLPEEATVTNNDSGTDDEADSDIAAETLRTPDYTLTSGQVITSVDAGIVLPTTSETTLEDTGASAIMTIYTGAGLAILAATIIKSKAVKTYRSQRTLSY